MATQTVKYNPQTGKALTKGQTVVVNGKKYTEGSTNISGTPSGSPVAKKSTIAPVAKKTSSGGSSKNSGSFTSASNPIATTKKTTPTSQILSTRNKDNLTISQAPKQSKISTFFSGLKNLVTGANAYSGYVGQDSFSTSKKLPDGSTSFYETPKIPTIKDKFNASPAVQTATDYINKATYQAPKEVVSSKKVVAPNTNNSQTMSLDFSAPENTTNSQNTDLSLGMGADRPLSGDIVSSSNNLSSTNAPAESKTTTVDPLTGAETVITQSLATPVPQTNVTATTNITGLTDGLLRDLTPGNPWDNNQRGEFQDTKIVNYQSSAANMFNSPQDVDNSYRGDSVFRANIDKTAKATNKSPQDILNGIKAKVQPVTNGIVPAQNTSQYLDLINTKKSPANIKAEAELLNKEVVMTSDFNTQQEKLAYDILEQTKKDSQAMLDSIARRELSRETTLREKSQFLIDKAKAEFDMKDAETEQASIQAETNLKEFLAHIGALNTDGNAQLGIENLKQKYQAQRQALRSNFELATREIQMNMNSDINELESKLDEDTLKINMDLSKTERDVALDVMKLRNDTNKSILDAQQKYATALRQERERVQSKAESMASDNIEKIRLLMSGGAEYQEATKLVSGKNYKNDSKSLTRVNELLSKKESSVTLTPTQKTDSILWLTKNKAPSWVIDGVKNGDENAILTTLRLMDDNN